MKRTRPSAERKALLAAALVVAGPRLLLPRPFPEGPDGRAQGQAHPGPELARADPGLPYVHPELFGRARRSSPATSIASRSTRRSTCAFPSSSTSPSPSGPAQEVVVALPLKVTYELLFQAIGPVEDKAVCDAVGDLVFRDAKGREEKVPFAFSGEFPIFKDPDVEFLPLRVNDLTVGGGDVVFDVKFMNPNGWDLIVDTIRYDLRFGDTSVLKGEIPGDKSVPAMGEKTLSLPFLLDFFETGKEVYDLLANPPAPCRFSGEIVIDSVWGLLTIAFDKSGPLALAPKAGT